MEGRWGRRIFGTVKHGDVFTVFQLVMETRDRHYITSTFRAPNEDLEHWPDHYGQILDKMVEQIDQRINHTQGDHP